MRRALSRLCNETFDLLIVGGGATGAFAARDAAMRGLKVALVEARDFAGATSAHNSKLAHGGLRYLRNLEIGLVRESLRERQTLLKIAPHLMRPLPFLLPLYGAGMGERIKLRAGLAMYDVLAGAPLGGSHLPHHRWLDADAALAREPVLAADNFEGAFEYHDAQMYAPERIALECLIDADAHDAALANYVAAEKLLLRDGRVEGASVRDTLTGTGFDIRARLTLVAAGPWADLFLEQATGKPATHQLLRSKGIHLLLPPITNADALTVEAGDGHFFVMPWRGRTLLGTTDTEFREDPSSLSVSESDVEGLLATANRYLPSAHLRREQVQFFYAGLRPLVKEKGENSYNASRRSELVDHKDDGLDGLLSALGGKWTTSRGLAQSVVDAAVKKLGVTAKPCTTATTPLPGGRFEDFDDFVKGAEKTWPGVPAIRHLAHMFGARLPRLLKNARLTDLARLGTSGDTGAQVAFAVEHEMALTLEDVVMRRTSLGQFGPLQPMVLDKIAAAMTAGLGWDDARKANEIDSLKPLYRTA